MPPANAGDAPGPLLAKLRARILRDGPLPVDQYMQACLTDPEHGYWRKPASIGADGDFTTAPEISQTFGELIGLWCAVAWQSLGQPLPLRLIELGPGRGTLMRDALRAAKLVPGFLDAIRVDLIEISPPMRERQRETLAASVPHHLAWHESLGDVPEGPAIVLANEFLDALPIRQLVSTDGAWHERVVEADPNGGLRFRIGDPAHDADGRAPGPAGAVLELRAGEDVVLAQLAARRSPLLALFIDYGPADDATGDTLQALHRHAYVDPLRAPGTADLTAHVAFAQLARKARVAALAADGPLSQAEFLGGLGIAERAARLMAANPDQASEIETGVQRLLSPTGMGQLFKVLSVRSRSLPPCVPFV
jgi:NADH dehydrogenase [ubiquinone] 1 alpha subcomplex assembly factor 7